jgi:hypothetical protein
MTDRSRDMEECIIRAVIDRWPKCMDEQHAPDAIGACIRLAVKLISVEKHLDYDRELLNAAASAAIRAMFDEFRKTPHQN